MTIAITVTGKDRPGIIAEITGIIYQCKGNLEDVTMTVLEGEFAMILLATFPNEAVLRKLEHRLERVKRVKKLWVAARKIGRSLVRGEKHQRGTVPYVISVLGRDRAGIVHKVSSVLAALHINITDLNSRITGRGAKSGYVLMIEADFPKHSNRVKQIIGRLQRTARALGVHLAVKAAEATLL